MSPRLVAAKGVPSVQPRCATAPALISTLALVSTLALISTLALGLGPAASPARAQDLTATFAVEGGADAMLTEALHDRFDWGGHVAARAGLELLGPLAVQVGFHTAWFPVEGQDPGNLYDITLGVRGFFPLEAGSAIGGPFVDVNGGVGITGDLVRFTFDVGAGWDFFPHPVFGVGPFVRYMQIVQPDDEPLGDDAHIITFGVQLTLRVDIGGAQPAPPVEPARERDPDGDGDGVPDARDGCRDAAEDIDGFRDDDGCPDDDNDSDGILDAEDRCPEAAETRNGFQDEDGCPDEAPPLSAPGPRHGEPLPQSVMFRLGSDRVSPRFRGPIEEVCAVAASRLDRHVRVLGHADEQGSAAANHRLGAMRAGAVAEQLVLCGVPPTRIESVSYGDTRPTCEGGDEGCRELNRRVVFELVPPR